MGRQGREITTVQAFEVQRLLNCSSPTQPYEFPFMAFLDHLVHQLNELSVHDCIALGFSFDTEQAYYGALTLSHWNRDGVFEGNLSIKISEQGLHRCFFWEKEYGATGPVWIDGRRVAVPVDAQGEPITTGSCRWAGERFLSIETPLRDHPLADAIYTHFYSQPEPVGLYQSLAVGLLIVDIETGHQYLEFPPADEFWVAAYVCMPTHSTLEIHAQADDVKTLKSYSLVRILHLAEFLCKPRASPSYRTPELFSGGGLHYPGTLKNKQGT
jgi:hypothetical protein